jgi:hypothetical protein
MIYVCDAIMGSGKSSAAIQYMNDHKDEKFIYVTPYLAEAARIKENCSDLHFIEPSNAYEEYGHTKSGHTDALIKSGANITTTHQSFKNYTPEMLLNIREKGYTLIIDESLDVLKECEFNEADIQTVINAGYVEEVDNQFVVTEKQYSGRKLRDIMWMLRSKSLVRTNDGKGIFYWSTPKELLESFKDVYILTYVFEGQSMYYYLKMNDMNYDNIYVQKTEDGKYRFSEENTHSPSYVKNLKNLIHILDNQRMNDVDFDRRSQKENECALSMNWFKRPDKKEKIEQLRRNLSNLYRYVYPDSTIEDRMWGTFSKAKIKLRGKGYTKNFVIFNERATNEYRNRKYLAYLANVYMDVEEKLFYQSLGVEIYEDTYALSTLVQWIWRSAIRDGKEIWIYLPSIRMRRLLTNWINGLTEEKEG